MGLLGDAITTRSDRVGRFNPRNPAHWVSRVFGPGAETASGITIGLDEAYSVPAWLAGIRMVSDDLATCTIHVFEDDPRMPKASRAVRDHPAADVLNWRANPEMTAFDFRSTLQGHALGRGTGFAEMQLDGAMRPVALWPLNPSKMRVLRNGRSGITLPGAAADELIFVYTLPSGEVKTFRKELVFTLPGFSSDGILGHSLIWLMREGIGLAKAAEMHGAAFYGNDASPGVYLKHPLLLDQDARDNLTRSWNQSHQGLSNAHRVAILEEGMELGQVGMNMADSEYVATRRFQVEEFARSLRIPLSKMGTPEGRTDNNVEHEDIAYVKGLVPWGTRWEQRLRFHGIIPAPRYAKVGYATLIKGDMKARAEFYHWMRQDGNLTANMILALEDMPLSESPVADELLIPVNMVPASTYDERGMTTADKYRLVNEMVLRGFDPAAALQAFGLKPVEHTGYVPTAVQLDPETSAKMLADQQKLEAQAQAKKAAASSPGGNDK